MGEDILNMKENLAFSTHFDRSYLHGFLRKYFKVLLVRKTEIYLIGGIGV